MTFIELDYLFVFLPLVVILYLVFRRTTVSTFGKTSIANLIILGASYYSTARQCHGIWCR